MKITLYTYDYFYKPRHDENRIMRATEFRDMKPSTTVVKCRRLGTT
jgi:hypothetical protein